MAARHSNEGVGSKNDASLAQTPLQRAHRELGARLVPFAGYEMPVQYAGVLEEHRAVREAAGLFDVSHMGEFEIRGRDAVEVLEKLVPTAVAALDPGRAAYSVLTTERGTIVDDLLIYRLGQERFWVVVNAANRRKDLDWILEHGSGFAVEVEDISERTALLAIQGPKARRIVAELADDFDAMKVKYYRFVEGKVAGRNVLASRTGYTGELGYELYLDAADALHVWNALLTAGADEGLRPAGLAARDTLRLEAGLPLYGNDIDEQSTVLEAGLDFVVDWTKSKYLGAESLQAQRDGGVAVKRSGFEIVGRGIARRGATVSIDGESIAEVTSGSFAPTLEKAIGMVYLPADHASPGREVEIDVRGRRLPAKVVELPFYRRPKPRRAQREGA